MPEKFENSNQKRELPKSKTTTPEKPNHRLERSLYDLRSPEEISGKNPSRRFQSASDGRLYDQIKFLLPQEQDPLLDIFFEASKNILRADKSNKVAVKYEENKPSQRQYDTSLRRLLRQTAPWLGRHPDLTVSWLYKVKTVKQTSHDFLHSEVLRLWQTAAGDSCIHYTPGRPDTNLSNYRIASDKAASQIRYLLFYLEARKQWIRDAGAQTDTPTSEDLQAIRRRHMLFSGVERQEEKSSILQVSRGFEQHYKHKRNVETVTDILNFHQEILGKILGKIHSTWHDLSDLLDPEDQKQSTRRGEINALYRHCKRAGKELSEAYEAFCNNSSYSIEKALEAFYESINSSLLLLRNLVINTFKETKNMLNEIKDSSDINEYTSIINKEIKNMYKMHRNARKIFYAYYNERYNILVVQALDHKNYNGAYKYHNKFANDVKEHLNTFLGTVDSFLQALRDLKQQQTNLTLSMPPKHSPEPESSAERAIQRSISAR